MSKSRGGSNLGVEQQLVGRTIYSLSDSTTALNEGSHHLALEREVVSYSMTGSVLMCGDMIARTGILN